MPLPRLLLIDDDARLLRALMRLLRRMIEMTSTTTTFEAAALLAAQSFDVVLCDLRMPTTDGESFAATLPSSIAALFVFMGGDEIPASVCSSHPRLLKPFTREELTRAIASRPIAATDVKVTRT